jgi:shikimate kinase
LPKTANVYLTGLSGSGKSTIGPLLAAHLAWSFVDTDQLIEESTGMTIADMFSSLGEEIFRNHEAGMIEHIAGMFREVVVSLGGGAIIAEENRSRMLETGLVVYLKASPKVLAGRLRQTALHRPLLQSGSEEELAENLERLLAARAPLYEHANITVEIDRLSEEQTVAQIMGALRL